MCIPFYFPCEIFLCGICVTIHCTLVFQSSISSLVVGYIFLVRCYMYAYSCLSWVSQCVSCPPDPTVLSRMGETIQFDNPYHTYTLLCGIKWDCPLHSHVYPILRSMWDMCDHPLICHVFQSYMSHCAMWGRWAIPFNTVCVPLHLSIISHCIVEYKWDRPLDSIVYLISHISHMSILSHLHCGIR